MELSFRVPIQPPLPFKLLQSCRLYVCLSVCLAATSFQQEQQGITPDSAFHTTPPSHKINPAPFTSNSNQPLSFAPSCDFYRHQTFSLHGNGTKICSESPSLQLQFHIHSRISSFGRRSFSRIAAAALRRTCRRSTTDTTNSCLLYSKDSRRTVRQSLPSQRSTQFRCFIVNGYWWCLRKKIQIKENCFAALLGLLENCEESSRVSYWRILIPIASLVAGSPGMLLA